MPVLLRISINISVIILLGFIFNACQQNQNLRQGPVLTVVPDPSDDNMTITATVQETISFDVTVNAPFGFRSLTVTTNIDGSSDDSQTFQPTAPGQLAFTTTYDLPVTSEMVNSEVAVEFRATNGNNISTLETYTIIAEAP